MAFDTSVLSDSDYLAYLRAMEEAASARYANDSQRAFLMNAIAQSIRSQYGYVEPTRRAPARRTPAQTGGFVGPSVPRTGGFVGPSVVPAPQAAPAGGFVGPPVAPAPMLDPYYSEEPMQQLPPPRQEFVGPVAPPGIVSMRNIMDTANDAYNPWAYAASRAGDFVGNNIVGPVLDFVDTYGQEFINEPTGTIEKYRPQVEGWVNQNIMQPLRNEVDYFWRQRLPAWLGFPPYAPGNYDETQWR